MQRLVALTMISGLLAGCHRGADARARVFPSSHDLAVQAGRSGASMAVIYWPQVNGCVPCEKPALESLALLSAENPDIRLTLVLPEGATNIVDQLGVRWHGSVVRLDQRSYQKQNTLTPLPRVEVWDRGGRLLLLKSIPPNFVQAAALGDEVRWAKARALPAAKVGG